MWLWETDCHLTDIPSPATNERGYINAVAPVVVCVQQSRGFSTALQPAAEMFCLASPNLPDCAAAFPPHSHGRQPLWL